MTVIDENGKTSKVPSFGRKITISVGKVDGKEVSNTKTKSMSVNLKRLSAEEIKKLTTQTKDTNTEISGNVKNVDRENISNTKVGKVVINLNRLSAAEIKKWTTQPMFEDANTQKSTNDVGRITRSKTRKCIDNSVVVNQSAKELDIANKGKKRRSDLSFRKLSKKPKLNDVSEITPTSKASGPNQGNNASNGTVANFPFKIDEVVWGKIRGPHWPCRIIGIGDRWFEVEWFNDYRTTKLYRSQLFKFCPNFEIFSEKFTTTVGLKDATEEALHYTMKKQTTKK